VARRDLEDAPSVGRLAGAMEAEKTEKTVGRWQPVLCPVCAVQTHGYKPQFYWEKS